MSGEVTSVINDEPRVSRTAEELKVGLEKWGAFLYETTAHLHDSVMAANEQPNNKPFADEISGILNYRHQELTITPVPAADTNPNLWRVTAYDTKYGGYIPSTLDEGEDSESTCAKLTLTYPELLTGRAAVQFFKDLEDYSQQLGAATDRPDSVNPDETRDPDIGMSFQSSSAFDEEGHTWGKSSLDGPWERTPVTSLSNFMRLALMVSRFDQTVFAEHIAAATNTDEQIA